MSLETIITYIIVLLVVGVVATFIYGFFTNATTQVDDWDKQEPDELQTKYIAKNSFDSAAVAGYIEKCLSVAKKLTKNFDCYILTGTLDADRRGVEDKLKAGTISVLIYEAARGSKVTIIRFIDIGDKIQVEGQDTDPDEKPPKPPN